jgi:hypothetical protein
MKQIILKDLTTILIQQGTILRAEVKNDGTTDYVEITCSDGVTKDLSYTTLTEFQTAYE